MPGRNILKAFMIKGEREKLKKTIERKGMCKKFYTRFFLGRASEIYNMNFGYVSTFANKKNIIFKDIYHIIYNIYESYVKIMS